MEGRADDDIGEHDDEWTQEGDQKYSLERVLEQ